ncbi:MAG: metallophosphoesterase family protein [Candidatus Omnitrophica bacterium]|nr:metallophosphoesterase family protein [Candidatus Omnitrophota bacterium]
MRIVVLSDTHMPRTAQDLPAGVYEEIEKSDMIVHAGDFVEIEILNKLRKLRPTKAVFGNMDSQAIRDELKQKEIVEIGRFKIGLVHGYGAPAGLVDTVASEFAGVDAIIFGHTHSPVNMSKDGVLFFNPGSPTDTVFAKTNSFGILEITDDMIRAKLVKL